MTTQEKIGLNIQRLRREKGLTQAAVASEAGINTNTYAKIERGVQTATIPMLEKIAEVLGVKLDTLFVFED
ncbi:MAG TPA: helix-turn-helix transcriptional regulator [Candidatus Saccharimonadales bacterium]|nr:helix-turn-helix transcriptional regulator [Candidatus Saccharimonadales bacterium]